MKWLFGNQTRVDKPPATEHKIIAFPRKHVPAPPRKTEDSRASFVPADFQSVDELLWKARQDIRRGLINPSAILIIAYDHEQRNVVWYQFGRENDEADEAFRDWLNEVVLDE